MEDKHGDTDDEGGKVTYPAVPLHICTIHDPGEKTVAVKKGPLCGFTSVSYTHLTLPTICSV